MEIKLRPWTLEDLDDLVKYADNVNIAQNMMDLFPHPYQVDHGLAFIEMTMDNTPPNILAIEIDGKACGSIGLHPQQDVFRKNAELGYWLAEPLWGKGIMPEAIRQMVTYGFSNWEINRIARPFGTNHRSQKVLEKAGFTLEAKLSQTVFKNGVYLDELIYSVRRPHTHTQQDETYTSPGFESGGMDGLCQSKGAVLYTETVFLRIGARLAQIAFFHSIGQPDRYWS